MRRGIRKLHSRMEVDDIFGYDKLVAAEKATLQKGMNYRVGKDYSVFLMSLRENAPYADALDEVCAIAAGGLGELVASHKRHGWARILSGGGCAISLAGGAYWFAFISSQVDRGDYDREFVATYSLYLYLFN